ncbi:hypothetical protein [Pseudomonas sp.]|uniref:hypothetical protein n=1 Tax=Pseudomonas sp. TaxID=306 RepID=UPI003263FC22
MRVPIFPKDLESGNGVLRLARCLQRDWPSKKTIKLSVAQNLMSTCLGYVDFHDVRMSADSPDRFFPSLKELHAQCFPIIRDELVKQHLLQDFSDDEMFDRICTWPFVRLSIFRIFSEDSGDSCVKLSKETFKHSKMTTLHYTKLASNPQLECTYVQTIFDRVKSALGHDSTETTMDYLKSPIGLCQRYDHIPAAPASLTECHNCGPASINSFKQNSDGS